jgi:hypothetical protein
VEISREILGICDLELGLESFFFSKFDDFGEKMIRSLDNGFFFLGNVWHNGDHFG